VELALLMALTL